MLGCDLSPDRIAAIALVLESRMTKQELGKATEHLITDPEVAEKLRYGGTLTPSDFLKSKQAATSTAAQRMEIRRGLPMPPPGSIDSTTMDYLIKHKGWRPEDFMSVGATRYAMNTYVVTNKDKIKARGAFVPWLIRPNS